MKGKNKILILLPAILFLQSCYTLLNPPATLPESYSTVTTEVAMGSSLGGSVFTGWDPYWEPVLPYTNYQRGYGASYYNPYNYYDYRNPYYAPIYNPVYIKGEKAPSVKGRSYGRADDQGSDRLREPKSTTSGQVMGNNSGGFSTAAAPISIPVVTNPTVQTDKQRSLKSAPAARETQRAVKSVKQVKSQPGKKKDTEKTESSSRNKRSRTRK